MQDNPLRSFPKVWALGHPEIDDLFDGTVECTEKIDGSQFSFGLRQGQYHCRSKGKDQTLATDEMFKLAVEQTGKLDLREDWTYRGEYLAKKKHNVLAYSRVPTRNVILFNIDVGYERYLPYDRMYEEAQRLGLEVVPILAHGNITDWETLVPLLDTTSCLGGPKIEGVVVKNYERFGRDSKVLMGKFVSEDFKERHSKEWRAEHNPGGKDIIEQLVTSFHKEALWAKAVQHLRDDGRLQHAPQDIGPLLAEIGTDAHAENAELIKETLFKWAWPKINRSFADGFASWYKEKLAKSQFTRDGV